MSEFVMTETEKLKDQDSRDKIKEKLCVNMIVEAGAGSGKTTEISNRIIALITSGYRTIDQIVAITFTRKAASELQDRVRKALLKNYDATRSEKVKHALDYFHLCYIGTIHSFCSKLIRERPVESSVDPGFTELDDGQDSHILSKVWENYVLYADELRLEILSKMDEMGIEREVIKEFLKKICENKDVDFEDDSLSELTFNDIERKINDIYDNMKVLLRQAIDSMPEGIMWDDMDGLQKTITKFNKMTINRKVPTFAEKLKFLTSCQTKSSMSVVQKRWGSSKEIKAWIKEESEKLKEYQTLEIIPAVELAYTFAYRNYIMPFVMDASELYEKYKARTGLLNFQDLLMTANNLLRNNSNIREYFKQKYKTILVDEFQDTDPIQAQMLFYLTGKDINEKKWNKIVPEEGSLFVVGDPKQSIYSFRRADIEIYNKFKEILLATGGESISLTTNFRSDESLVSWYNNTFENLMTNNENSIPEGIPSTIRQADFEPLSTITHALPETLTGVEYYWVDASSTSEVVATDCYCLEKLIKWMVDSQEITTSKITGSGDKKTIEYQKRNVTYKDIMVLSVKKKNLSIIGKHLSASGIPVRVAGADVVQKTPIFMELANVIRMLAQPEENAYLYQVMTGKAYGFIDEEIYRYIAAGGLMNIYFDMRYILEESDEKDLLNKVQECFNQLKTFARMSQKVTGAVLTEYILDKLRLRRELLKNKEEAMQLSGLQSLLEKLRLMAIDDIWGLNDYLTEMAAIIDQGYEDELNLEGTDYNSVTLMNLHKSKGLEAPIVILSMPCSGKTPEETFYVERKNDDVGNMSFRGHVKIDLNPGTFLKQYIKSEKWDSVEHIANYKKGLEFIRLLYVAATRAGKMLVVSMSGEKTNPWERFFPFMTDKTDLIQRIPYEDENKEVAATSDSIILEKEEQLTSIELNEKIEKADKIRNMKFENNKPTYSYIVPSEMRGSEQADENEKLLYLIAHNTIQVVVPKGIDDLDVGLTVHSVFDSVIKAEIINKESENSFVDKIAENHEILCMNKQCLTNLINAFRNSYLYKRLLKAEEIYTEMPFSYKQTVNGMDYYINGRIDLLFKENGNWTIVDYKTCEFKAVKHELYYEYLPQLETYANAWNAANEEKNVNLEVFFVEKVVG